MTLQELIQKRPKKLSARDAANIMGCTLRHLHLGLQREKYPFGSAVQMDGGRWSYYINVERFLAWMTAQDLRAAQ